MERVLEMIEERIEEMKNASEKGIFTKDYLQGQASGMITALHILDAITTEQAEELYKRTFSV